MTTSVSLKKEVEVDCCVEVYCDDCGDESRADIDVDSWGDITIRVRPCACAEDDKSGEVQE